MALPEAETSRDKTSRDRDTRNFRKIQYRMEVTKNVISVSESTFMLM